MCVHHLKVKKCDECVVHGLATDGGGGGARGPAPALARPGGRLNDRHEGAGGGRDPGHCPVAPMLNSAAGLTETARVENEKVRRVFRIWTAWEGGRPPSRRRAAIRRRSRATGGRRRG
jgi:hypothetical protein